MTRSEPDEPGKLLAERVFLIVLGAVAAVIAAVYTFKLQDRLLELAENTERWKKMGADDWVRLDDIERSFIYFSFAMLAAGLVCAVIISVCRSRLPAVCFMYTAALLLWCFTLTQKELFFEDHHIGCMVRSSLFMTVAAAAMTFYYFGRHPAFGAAAFVFSGFAGFCLVQYGAGPLSITREFSMPWFLFCIVITLMMTAAGKCREKIKEECEQAVK